MDAALVKQVILNYHVGTVKPGDAKHYTQREKWMITRSTFKYSTLTPLHCPNQQIRFQFLTLTPPLSR